MTGVEDPVVDGLVDGLVVGLPDGLVDGEPLWLSDADGDGVGLCVGVRLGVGVGLGVGDAEDGLGVGPGVDRLGLGLGTPRRLPGPESVTTASAGWNTMCADHGSTGAVDSSTVTRTVSCAPGARVPPSRLSRSQDASVRAVHSSALLPVLVSVITVRSPDCAAPTWSCPGPVAPPGPPPGVPGAELPDGAGELMVKAMFSPR